MPLRGSPSAVSQCALSFASHCAAFRNFGHHFCDVAAYCPSVLSLRVLALGYRSRTRSSSAVTSSGSGPDPRFCTMSYRFESTLCLLAHRHTYLCIHMIWLY